MYLSPSHLVCFITMIHFCKKSLHSFFNNVTSTSQQHSSTPDHCRNTMPFGGVGLSVLANYDDFPKPNNVVQSLCFINGSRKIKEALELEKNKRDHVEIRIKGLGGGDADGLGSCTESLGFESCTERSVSNEYGIDFYDKTRVNKKSKIVERRKEWNFPPPLKSLDDNGKPMFVLKPVRKDGRLELTEVQIHRQESLHACREDGRLRMYLVELNPTNDGEISVDTEDELSDTKEIKLADTKEKLVVEEEWKFPENCGGGEDCRWLNEMVVSHGDHHHHHHNMHGWGQQCVTIR